MQKALGSLAIAALLALAFAQPSHAAQRATGPNTEEVCAIARDMCMAACKVNNPGDDFNSGLLRDLCERECDEQRKACENGGGSSTPARQSHRKLSHDAFDFAGNGAGSEASNDKPTGAGSHRGSLFKAPATGFTIQ